MKTFNIMEEADGAEFLLRTRPVTKPLKVPLRSLKRITRAEILQTKSFVEQVIEPKQAKKQRAG